MGNNQQQKYELPKYEWVWAGNHNGLDLYKRQSDGLIAEKRRIVLDHRFTLQNQKQIYKLRENNNLGFVRVYQVDGVQDPKAQEKSNICKCAESTTLNVYSERIEHRLSDLPQLTFPESLHILWEATNSFQHIYEKFGPFHINGELIGVAADNKIKVWVNQNFALNHPSHQIPYLKTMTNYDLPPELRNQNEMINNLLQVIEQKTESGRFPQPFGEGAYQSARSFHQLKRYLNNYMQNQYKDYVPDVIKRSTVLASNNQLNSYGYAQNVQPLAQKATPIKQSFIQSTYHPIQDHQPLVSDRVITSAAFPQGIDNRASSKPVINFGNTQRPTESISLQINPTNTVYHTTPMQGYTNLGRPVEFNTNANQQPIQFPKFRLVNQNNHTNISQNQQTTMYIPQPIITQNYGSRHEFREVSSEAPRPQLQLQKIRNMLKQDISELSGHSSQYRIGVAGETAGTG